MRLGIALCVCALVLTGCADTTRPLPPAAESGNPVSLDAEPSDGVDAPADDPLLKREDERGFTPDESVLALIDARNRLDWSAAYSAYATPSVDLATAAREWGDANETYVDFTVREVRVTDSYTAWVRVSYTVSSGPSSSSQPAKLEEWWTVHKVDGIWKTRWMPRQ